MFQNIGPNDDIDGRDKNDHLGGVKWRECITKGNYKYRLYSKGYTIIR